MMKTIYNLNDINRILNGESWFAWNGTIGQDDNGINTYDRIDPKEVYSNDDILVYLYINTIIHKEFVNLAKIGRYELTTENRMGDITVVNTFGTIDMNFGIRENFVQCVYNFADKVISEIIQTIGRDNTIKYTFPEIRMQIGNQIHIQTSTKIQVL